MRVYVAFLQYDTPAVLSLCFVFGVIFLCVCYFFEKGEKGEETGFDIYKVCGPPMHIVLRRVI
jgi:hypothetical protein